MGESDKSNPSVEVPSSYVKLTTKITQNKDTHACFTVKMNILDSLLYCVEIEKCVPVSIIHTAKTNF